MKKHYPWLWFDADNTLFDYNLAESTALLNTFQLHGLPIDDASMEKYRKINHKLWRALERGEIKPDVLRVKRFEQFLEVGLQRLLEDALWFRCFEFWIGFCHIAPRRMIVS